MIISNSTIRADVVDLWKAGGLPPGQSTGWDSVDKLYTVGLNQWTVVTGTPNSGKSEWVDALMVNLVLKEKWRFFIYSPENHPLTTHHSKILEKYIGKPFGPGPTERMSLDEVYKGEDWMEDKFFFGKFDKPDILSIVSEAENSVADMTHTNARWKTGVVIDPWNQLEHYRPPSYTETEYVSKVLSDVIAVVRRAPLHLWLVAHPAKLYRDRDGKYPIPTPRDISGSAHFWNKADNCITVHRDQVEGSQDVDIHVQKVRFKHIGKIGLATLKYDRVTGKYHEPFKAQSNVRDFKIAAAGGEGPPPL